MTKPTPISDAVVLVAIDVANGDNEVLIHVPGHPRRRRLTVLNTKGEHDCLVVLLERALGV